MKKGNESSPEKEGRRYINAILIQKEKFRRSWVEKLMEFGGRGGVVIILTDPGN